MGRLIQGYWDCKHCDTKKISGLDKKCPNCGKTRDNSTVFYMDETSPYIDDDVAKTISRNPDWLCEFCGSLNSDNLTECYNCGATKEDSFKTYFENKKKREEKQKKIDDQIKKSYTDDEEVKTDRNTYQSNIEKVSSKSDSVITKSKKPFFKSIFSNKKLLKIGAISLTAILIITSLIFLFIPKTVEGTVEDFSWERTIAIEELKTFNESDWSLPSGARLQYSQTEIASYKQVIDHYETKTVQKSREVISHYETYVSGYRDLGNGTFEEILSQRPVYTTEYYTETIEEPVYRSEPVYATKYYYEIDRWTHTRSVETKNNDKTPFWGEVVLKEKERECNKSEKYFITVLSEEKTNKYSVKYDLWNSLKNGDKVKLKVNIFGEAKLDTE